MKLHGQFSFQYDGRTRICIRLPHRLTKSDRDGLQQELSEVPMLGDVEVTGGDHPVIIYYVTERLLEDISSPRAAQLLKRDYPGRFDLEDVLHLRSIVDKIILGRLSDIDYFQGEDFQIEYDVG